MTDPDVTDLIQRASNRGHPVGADTVWWRASQELSNEPSRNRHRRLPVGMALVAAVVIALAVVTVTIQASHDSSSVGTAPAASTTTAGPGPLPAQRIGELTFADGHTEAIDAWLDGLLNGSRAMCIRIRGTGCTGFQTDVSVITLESSTPPPDGTVVLLVPGAAETVAASVNGSRTAVTASHPFRVGGSEVGIAVFAYGAGTSVIEVSAVSTAGEVIDAREIPVG